MPKNKNAFIRYRIIDGCLRNKHQKFPTKQDLIEACSGLGSVSERTIDKDIYDMKYDEELGYQAPIEYDRKLRGYYYSDPDYSISKIPLKQEDLYAIEFACSLLKQFEGIAPVQQFVESIEKIEDYINLHNIYGNDDFLDIIQTEKGLSNKGTEHLSPVLLAIKEHNVIIIHYQRFGHEVKHYSFEPYVLKEYRNRWYVTGRVQESNRITTFATERITHIIPTKNKFEKDPSFNVQEYFKHSFGISVYNNYEPVVVELSFDAGEAPYIKSQPLHETQQIIADTEKELRIRLHVIPSYELKSSILSYGDKVKVISPENLREEHKLTLEKALKKYQQP